MYQRDRVLERERERERYQEKNACLIKKSTAGYQCGTRALEILLVAPVTAKTHSGEYQCKKVSMHKLCMHVVEDNGHSLTFVSVQHSANPFTL